MYPNRKATYFVEMSESTDTPTVSDDLSQPSTSPTKNPTFLPTISPTSEPTVSPTVPPTVKPTSSPTQSPTKELFPTARLSITISDQTTRLDPNYQKNMQCYVNFLFGRLNTNAYKWKDDLPFDNKYPSKLVPRVTGSCPQDNTDIPVTETPSSQPVIPSTKCTLQVDVHMSSNPISFSPSVAPTTSPIASNTSVMEVLTFVKSWGDSSSPLLEYRVGSMNLEAAGYKADRVEDTPAVVPNEADAFCINLPFVIRLPVGTGPTPDIPDPVDSPTSTPTSEENNGDEGLTIFFSVFIPLTLFFLLIFYFVKRTRQRDAKKNEKSLDANNDALETTNTTFESLLREFQDSDGLKIDLKRLKLEKPIGHGANGRIFKASYAGSQAAVKEVYGENLGDFFETGDISEEANKKFKNILREVKLLKMLRHPHIIQLFGCAFSKSTDTGVWRFLIVMELAACSLHDVLERPGSLRVKALPPILHDTKSTLSFAKQICAGCAYIHDNNMVHFDIKPANILVDFSGNAKICDLGIAKMTSSSSEQQIEKTMAGLGGTPCFMSPELLEGDRTKISQPVDVYAFGIVLWQIFHKESPQPSNWGIPQLFSAVLNDNYRPKINESLVDDRIKEIIELCWNRDFKKRPTFHDLIKIFTEYQQKKEEEMNIIYEVDDKVLVWSYDYNEYIEGKIIKKYQVDKKIEHLQHSNSDEVKENKTTEGEKNNKNDDTEKVTYFEVFIFETEEVIENIVETDLLPYNEKRSMNNNLRTVANLALKNHTGRTIKVLHNIDKTFVVKDGSFEMQGLVFTKAGVVMKESLINLNFGVDFVLKIQLLGQGACGAVYSALHLKNFSLVAIKEIAMSEKGARHQTVKELQALWKNLVDESCSSETQTITSLTDLEELPKMKCPYIVGFYGAFYTEAKNSVSVVMEFMDGGSLQDILDAKTFTLASSPLRRHQTSGSISSFKKEKNFDKYLKSTGIVNEEVLANITRNILQALVFIHNMKLVHLDIKPANILINVFGQAKLADFGLANN